MAVPDRSGWDRRVWGVFSSLKAGLPGAAEEFVNLVKPRLFAIARTRWHLQVSDSEDAIQDALQSLWRHREKVCRPWKYMVSCLFKWQFKQTKAERRARRAAADCENGLTIAPGKRTSRGGGQADVDARDLLAAWILLSTVLRACNKIRCTF